MAFEMTPERRTGLIFGAVVALVLGLIVVVLTTSEPAGIRITIVFDNVQGLRAGDPVEIAGVPIGSVETVELGPAHEPVRVGVKIDIQHRKRVAANATAIIKEAAPAQVPGQKAVEIVNAEQPEGPIRPGAVMEGRESEFDLTIWKMRDKVERWGREIESTAEVLAQAAREALEDASRRRSPDQRGPSPADPEPDRGADLRGTPSSPAPEGETPARYQPEDPGREGPASPPATPSRRQPWIEPETIESLTAAKEFIQEFVASDEFKDLIARLMAFMARLNDEKNPPTPDEIIREWDGVKRDIDPLMRRLEEVDRQAAMERLIAIIEDIEEEIGPILEYLERRREDRKAPPESNPGEAEEETVEV